MTASWSQWLSAKLIGPYQIYFQGVQQVTCIRIIMLVYGTTASARVALSIALCVILVPRFGGLMYLNSCQK